MKIQIKRWWWKNFASYGDIEQAIELLPDKGELILLQGINGNGKSSCLQSLDVALFGECFNKRGKRLGQKLIPNRINGNMENGVDFATDDYDIIIKRQLSSALKTQLYENGEKNDKAGKIQDRINQIIGYDIDTFKSFVSVNVNIFKDFINLSPDDKRTILDKLFNLEQINSLNKILKQLATKNNGDHSSVQRELQIYEKNIQDMKRSIEEIEKKSANNNEEKLKNLKAELKKQQEPYKSLEAKKEKYENKFEEINDQLRALKERRNEIARDKKDVLAQIVLFDEGKCPTCGTDLSVQLNVKADLQERLDKTQLVMQEVDDTISEWNEALTEGKKKYALIDAQWDTLVDLINDINSQIKHLQTNAIVVDIEPIRDNIKEAEETKVETETKFLDAERLKTVYDLLLPIWGEQGIKRDIIAEIVPTLNEFIAEDLETLKTRFNVELDDNFDAHIFEWNNEIDPDTLSTGEAKKINLIIMLAYLKISRLKRFVNLLILDEVFASVDINGTEDILLLLRKYANERGINIVIVHFAELNRSLFDRIISVKKGAFSYLEDERLN